MLCSLGYVIFTLFGLCLGSFLNVLIDRLPKREKITGRSYCPHCKKKLNWYELIPLLSFVFLKGKCSACKKPISLQYPLVELATGILFPLTIYTYNSQLTTHNLQSFLTLCCLLSITCYLVVIFGSDVKYYIVPDEIIYSAIFFALCYQIISNIQDFKSNFFKLFSALYPSFLSAVGAAVFFLLILFVTKGKGMGLGDVKIATFMGLFLSFPNILVALFISFFSGSIVGLILIALKKKTLKSKIPLAAFLAPATYIVFFWGGKIIERYLTLFKY